MLLPNPHPKQAEFLSDTHRYKVLNWGRRTGKSVIVWEKVVLEGMLRQGLYYIVAPTYKQAKAIYWRDICKRYKDNAFMVFNEQELSITFKHLRNVTIPTTAGDVTITHDPDLPETRIELKGADNPDSLRGTGLCGAVLDEYAFMPDGKYIYDVIIRPALADKNGWVVFISTPNGMYNHFYDLCLRAQAEPETYFFSHATAKDNIYFPQVEFDEARKEYEKDGKIDQFTQEWLAEFRNPSTSVYSEFDRDKHVFTDINDMPLAGTDVLGIDFGMTDPTAAVFVRIDYDGNWWIYDEIYQTDLHLDQLVYVLREKMGDRHYSRIIGDGAARFELDSLKKRRFAITGAKKGADSIAAGINEVKAKLKVREGTGKPKLFVHASCKNTIKEFESYQWISDAFGEVTNVPEDKNNHAMDALRYLCLTYAAATKREKKPKNWSHLQASRSGL